MIDTAVVNGDSDITGKNTPLRFIVNQTVVNNV